MSGLGLLESVWPPHTKRFGLTRVCLAPPKTSWVYTSPFGPTQNGLCLLLCLAPPKTVWIYSGLLGPTQNDFELGQVDRVPLGMNLYVTSVQQSTQCAGGTKALNYFF